MSELKYYTFVYTAALVLLLAFNGRTFSQTEVFEDGEELYYEVYYSFINIGWTKFYTERVSGKSNYFKTYATLKSNEALPFVNVNYEFISEIEVTGGRVMPHKFTAYQYKDNKKLTITHDFHYDSNYIYIKKIGFDGNTEIDKKIYTSTLFQDGLSILYYARYYANKNESRNVPVIMHVDTALMQINFSNKKTEVSIGEVDYDISSLFLDGFSYFKAVFGLTGEFSGWFSNDAARIPLKAKLEVEIGSITLELKWWKRGSWSPPKY
ncbi:MAG: DUF3108 domain-containing protein [Chlorobi bacterium]|nr:DUF3108 domain-containing protein [Chlorobiota bacterium]